MKFAEDAFQFKSLNTIYVFNSQVQNIYINEWEMSEISLTMNQLGKDKFKTMWEIIACRVQIYVNKFLQNNRQE